MATFPSHSVKYDNPWTGYNTMPVDDNDPHIYCIGLWP